jgi:hypothetical protein
VLPAPHQNHPPPHTHAPSPPPRWLSAPSCPSHCYYIHRSLLLAILQATSQASSISLTSPWFPMDPRRAPSRGNSEDPSRAECTLWAPQSVPL